MTLRCKVLIPILWLLLTGSLWLPAQVAEHAAEEIGKESTKSAAEKAADANAKAIDDAAAEVRKATEDWQKYQEEERKYYERYSTPDREYYGWFSSAEIKKPFNEVLDNAIVAIRQKEGAKLFKNAGNQQIVDALSAQSQALPPPDRLTLTLHEHWFTSDSLDVSKADSSASASVRMSSLKDYISDAIDQLTYPPVDPSKVVLHPRRVNPNTPLVPTK